MNSRTMNSQTMNARIQKSVLEMKARSWLRRSLAFALFAFSIAGWLTADEQRTAPDLTVHEWGTFTAIAGKDGRAVEWLPLGLPRYPASTDLPKFVEHISDVNFKLGLRGTIRMETPVMYFYSPREVNVSARVAFSRGLITEWYPHADRVQPGGVLRNASLNRLQADGSIAWNDVSVSPNLAGEFPREAESNRYYAARENVFFAAPRQDKRGRAAGEVPFLSGGFRKSITAVCQVELRRKAGGEEPQRRRNSGRNSL